MNNNGMRQVQAGYFGVVTSHDRKVSEPVHPILAEIAQALAGLPTAEALGALVSLFARHDEDTIQMLDHLQNGYRVNAGVNRPVFRGGCLV